MLRQEVHHEIVQALSNVYQKIHNALLEQLRGLQGGDRSCPPLWEIFHWADHRCWQSAPCQGDPHPPPRPPPLSFSASMWNQNLPEIMAVSQIARSKVSSQSKVMHCKGPYFVVLVEVHRECDSWKQSQVLVIGGGVAGLSALGTAKNMGAITRVFDTR